MATNGALPNRILCNLLASRLSGYLCLVLKPPSSEKSIRKSPTDYCDYKYRIEGNVANGLRMLQKHCKTPAAQRVPVLREGGENSIHSFDEFTSKHYNLYGCALYAYVCSLCGICIT